VKYARCINVLLYGQSRFSPHTVMFSLRCYMYINDQQRLPWWWTSTRLLNHPASAPINAAVRLRGFCLHRKFTLQYTKPTTSASNVWRMISCFLLKFKVQISVRRPASQTVSVGFPQSIQTNAGVVLQFSHGRFLRQTTCSGMVELFVSN